MLQDPLCCITIARTFVSIIASPERQRCMEKLNTLNALWVHGCAPTCCAVLVPCQQYWPHFLPALITAPALAQQLLPDIRR